LPFLPDPPATLTIAVDARFLAQSARPAHVERLPLQNDAIWLLFWKFPVDCLYSALKIAVRLAVSNDFERNHECRLALGSNPVRSLCRRMVCTKCGMIDAGVRPDWSPHVNRICGPRHPAKMQ
jgi:hypothetical protein